MSETGAERQPGTERCLEREVFQGWACSLPKMHSGAHCAFRLHDLRGELLVTWAQDVAVESQGTPGATPQTFPDCNIGTAHECCVARMKRLEKERYGVEWPKPAGGTLTAEEFYFGEFQKVILSLPPITTLRGIWAFAGAFSAHNTAALTRERSRRRFTQKGGEGWMNE